MDQVKVSYKNYLKQLDELQFHTKKRYCILHKISSLKLLMNDIDAWIEQLRALRYARASNKQLPPVSQDFFSSYIRYLYSQNAAFSQAIEESSTYTNRIKDKIKKQINIISGPSTQHLPPQETRFLLTLSQLHNLYIEFRKISVGIDACLLSYNAITDKDGETIISLEKR